MGCQLGHKPVWDGLEPFVLVWLRLNRWIRLSCLARGITNF
jgi:hypothetical protein